jgi:phosphoglycerol transferase MdoB-like AlkP superfamily enzyme
MKKTVQLVIYYFLIILYLEFWHKSFFYPTFWNIGLIYTTLYSFIIALLLTFLSSLGRPKTNKRIILLFTVLLTLIFTGNYIYTTLFGTPFSIQVTSMAGGALDFLNIFFDTLFKNISNLIILSLPLIGFICKYKKMNFEKTFYFEKKSLIYLIIGIYIVSLTLLFPFKDHDKSAFKLYWKENDIISSINMFGLITAERIEIQRNIFGFNETLAFEENDTSSETQEMYNKIDIDFDKLIENAQDANLKSVYSYFKNTPATKKNEYTGMFAGKNLIFVLAESFNSVVVSKENTPTLYRLINDGFHFTNFYSPLVLSTTGGEFQAMTGLIPSADTVNEWHNGKAYLPYAIGNMFLEKGYTTNAYHNWKYDFYTRNFTMPELGFPDYLACENGLEKIADCYWNSINAPEDQQLITSTIKKYTKEEKFLTYYITMSGHAPYLFESSKRYYDEVKDLPYSDETKAYIASQMDLDKAMEVLIASLEEEGLLEDTVICLVGDHYPYAMDISNINEMSTYPRDELFEVHHSDFIIWNKNQEKVEINKVGSQMDVLPTILNLFGLEYDSRLLIGKDLLSDSEGLAIFSDLSWISDSGTYQSKNKKFTSKKDVNEDYVSKINQWVNNGVIVSRRIILEDIYRKLFESLGE